MTKILRTFTIGESIQGSASDEDDWYIKATITGIPGTKILTNDGALNETSDTIKVVAGGIGAIFNIDEVGSGGITDVVINNKGSNYEVGDKLVFDNTGGSTLGGLLTVTGDVVISHDLTVQGTRPNSFRRRYYGRRPIFW